MGVDGTVGRLARDMGADLALELADRISAGSGHRLVGVDDDPLQSDGVAERHEHRHELHRRAVRVGDDARVALHVVGIDLADDERDGRVHSPGRAVVDDRRAAGDGERGELARGVAAGREEGDVDAVEGLPGREFDLAGRAVDRDRLAGGPLRGEQAQVADGELPFEKDLDHRPPDDAGGADDRDGEVLACHVGHGSAVTVAGRAPREYISGAVRDPGRSAVEENGPRSVEGAGRLAVRAIRSDAQPGNVGASRPQVMVALTPLVRRRRLTGWTAPA